MDRADCVDESKSSVTRLPTLIANIDRYSIYMNASGGILGNRYAGGTEARQRAGPPPLYRTP